VSDKFTVEIIKGDAIQKQFALPKTQFGPEMVVYLRDADTNEPAGFVVVDNLVMGPSLGGTRLAPDVTVQEVYGLAHAMTFKNAGAMLPIGGGKSGLLGDPAFYRDNPDKKKALISSFAEALWPVKEYIPGPDMGTDELDMQLIYDTYTRLNGAPNHGRGGVGRPPEKGGVPLDEWGLTAHGLYAAAKTIEKERDDFQLEGARVVVQGYGNVGSPIAHKLKDVGAVIVGASDINAGIYHPDGLDLVALDHARKEKAGLDTYSGAVETKFSARELEKLLEVPCDILVPAARPDAVMNENKDRIQARIILQGANNPVKPEIEADLMKERGIISLTDFIVNAGGVIACAVELKMDADSGYCDRVRKEDGSGRAYMEKLVYKIISTNVREICDRVCKGDDIMWRDAARDMAMARLARGPEATKDSLIL